mmetsp:Transcript_8811/g.18081  ORF Transcript_8811/g.18081 Transcript_8811/m.18081 type:complete len:243 (-) Transcript_8811:53-781(-)
MNPSLLEGAVLDHTVAGSFFPRPGDGTAAALLFVLSQRTGIDAPGRAVRIKPSDGQALEAHPFFESLRLGRVETRPVHPDIGAVRLPVSPGQGAVARHLARMQTAGVFREQRALPEDGLGGVLRVARSDGAHAQPFLGALRLHRHGDGRFVFQVDIPIPLLFRFQLGVGGGLLFFVLFGPCGCSSSEAGVQRRRRCYFVSRTDAGAAGAVSTGSQRRKSTDDPPECQERRRCPRNLHGARIG